MTKKPTTAMQAHTARLHTGHTSGKVPATSESSTTTSTAKPRSSPKPGGYLVHPNAAGKVGSVPVKPNPRKKMTSR